MRLLVDLNVCKWILMCVCVRVVGSVSKKCSPLYSLNEEKKLQSPLSSDKTSRKPLTSNHVAARVSWTTLHNRMSPAGHYTESSAPFQHAI